MTIIDFINNNIGLVMFILLVVIMLKGFSLWFAARYEKKPYWFIVLLIFNTLGLLELTYLIFFRKTKEVNEDEKRN